MKTSGNLSFIVNSLATFPFISAEPGLCPPANRRCKPVPLPLDTHVCLVSPQPAFPGSPFQVKGGRKASISSHSCPSKPQAGPLPVSCTPALVGFRRVVTGALAGGGEGCKCLEGLPGFVPLETPTATKPGYIQGQMHPSPGCAGTSELLH